jgi:hypothetical protein
MVYVSVISFETYKELINNNENISKLQGNETIYPACFSQPLIQSMVYKTTDFENMKNFYFRLNMDKDTNVYLQPKQTHELYDLSFYFQIVVSDDVYKQYFMGKNNDMLVELEAVYNISNIDMLELTRLEGDYPQDSSIDILLTSFLESSSIMNMGQEFVLYFEGNQSPFKNYIIFKVNEIIFKEDEEDEEDADELDETICSVISEQIEDVITLKSYNKTKKEVGLVANNEVKINFVEIVVPECKKESQSEQPQIKYPLQKARQENNVIEKGLREPPIFKSKGLVLNESNKFLSKEEIRKLREEKFRKI